jgi:Domain of unknown function (DUF1996)/F5/8 type C domain
MRPAKRPLWLWRVVLPAIALVVAGTVIAIGPFSLASSQAVPLSQGRPVIASSVEGGHFGAANAVDGDHDSRWSSVFADPQWIQVDLGTPVVINQVVLQWERASAKAFQLQVSDNGIDWSAIYSTTTGAGGTVTLPVTGTGRYVRMLGTARATAYGYSLFEFQVFGTPAGGTTPTPTSGAPTTMPGTPTPPAGPTAAPTTPTGAPAPTGGYVMADPPVTGVKPATGNPAHAYFHEFQANCAVTKHAPDDPIVFFNQPGASHDHTFLGNTTTNAASTTQSLLAGGTQCKAPGDKSGYWMPTMYNGSTTVLPTGPQVIYYKTGINDYTAVRPFPTGLRFVVGSPTATAAQFAGSPGYVAGWECGNSYHNIDFPLNCPAGTELNLRYQAPSCWDGLHLDSPDHKSHMAYPVDGVCPVDHPVALPMIEFKMAFPVSGDMSQVRLSSGRAFSFHYDFFNAWDPATLQALVTHCVNGGLQCDSRGYDQTQAGKGAALNEQYLLPLPFCGPLVGTVHRGLRDP